LGATIRPNDTPLTDALHALFGWEVKMMRMTDKHWNRLPTIAGTRMLAAMTVAAAALVLLPDIAAAQATAAQRNAVRQYCRADFAAKCPGVSTGEALICLEANLDHLSRGCKKAVLATLGADSESEPVANAAPSPEPSPAPRANSRTAPIVSNKPPGLNPNAHSAKRRGAPPAPEQASSEPPPNFATKRRGAATKKTAAPPDTLPPESEKPDTRAPDRADTAPPERAASRSAAPPPRRAVSAPPRTADPLVWACWSELNHSCRGMRAGGGRELACLSKHPRSLSRGCWSAYRTALSRSRR